MSDDGIKRERSADTPAFISMDEHRFVREYGTDGPLVKITYNGRDNPSCPKCGRYNALLYGQALWVDSGDAPSSGRVMTGHTRKCRDCGAEYEFSSCAMADTTGEEYADFKEEEGYKPL